MASVLEKLEKIRDVATAKMNEIIEAYTSRMLQTETHAPSEELDIEAETTTEVVETSVETPKAKNVAPTEPKTRNGLNGGVNRSQVIRDFFKKNKDASNKEAADFLKKEYNLEASAGLISVIRSKMDAPKVKRGRKPDAMLKAKRGRKPNGENRSELIRNFFEKNRESRNKDVVEFLNRKGLEVSPELVSAIRSKLGLPKSRKTGNVRMVKAEKMRKDKAKSDLPLPAILTRVFKGSRNGYKLAELPDLVQKAGYKYGGERGRDGIVQNIYQALRILKKKKTHPGWVGETPVVIHDAESQRWKLNPKAKREVA